MGTRVCDGSEGGRPCVIRNAGEDSGLVILFKPDLTAKLTSPIVPPFFPFVLANELYICESNIDSAELGPKGET
jgi:hypothetical protein